MSDGCCVVVSRAVCKLGDLLTAVVDAVGGGCAIHVQVAASVGEWSLSSEGHVSRIECFHRVSWISDPSIKSSFCSERWRNWSNDSRYRVSRTDKKHRCSCDWLPNNCTWFGVACLGNFESREAGVVDFCVRASGRSQVGVTIRHDGGTAAGLRGLGGCGIAKLGGTNNYVTAGSCNNRTGHGRLTRGVHRGSARGGGDLRLNGKSAVDGGITLNRKRSGERCGITEAAGRDSGLSLEESGDKQ